VSRTFRIAYLNEEADLSGGVRVILGQADALVARGHQVTIVSKGPSPDWIPTRAEWRTIDSFDQIDASAFDFVIGTFWTTVPAARNIAGDRAIHLCQGYEGSFSFYSDRLQAIQATYRLPIPKIVVSDHLVEVLRPWTSDVHVVGQMIDPSFFRSSRGPESDPLRVLVCGAHQVDLKGIDDAYGAVLHARSHGWKVTLVRVSPWAPSREEPHDVVADEFHVALSANAMRELVHSCDVVLAASHPEEGFGLPAVEAMAAMLPAVLTSIPSYLALDPAHDYALFAEPRNPIDLGERLMELLEDYELRDRIAMRGREVASRFRPEGVASRLESFFEQRERQLTSGRVRA
jgi:glycosyltransferase involved in cell wall biosynthesis